MAKVLVYLIGGGFKRFSCFTLLWEMIQVSLVFISNGWFTRLWFTRVLSIHMVRLWILTLETGFRQRWFVVQKRQMEDGNVKGVFC